MSRQIHISRILSHPANIRETLGNEDELEKLATQITRHHGVQKIPADVREAFSAEVQQLIDLAVSIKAHGILQPLLVHQHATDKAKYVILAGHRRFAAAKLANLDEVPCIVRERHASWTEATEIMLVENCQRRDLSAMEKAEAMGALLNAGYSQAEIARKTGFDISTVNYYLALLDLDQTSQERVRRGELSTTAAVKVVRTVRQVNRMMQGQKTRGPAPKERHFDFTHPLALEAHKRCDHQKERVIVGKVACGPCWEHVIRRNARKVDR